MKKLITTLALASACVVGANAQTSSDFESVVLSISDTIMGCASGDSLFVTFGYINNGPDALAAGETLAVQGVWNEEGYASGLTLEEDFNVGDTITLTDAYVSADILTLVNQASDAIIPAPFTAGERYFWYTRVVAFESSTYTDDNADNDLAGFPLYWCNLPDPASILNMSTATNINVYPNPTKGSLNFSYDFEKSSAVTANVYDVTGRMVATQDFGTQNAGTQVFTLNVANLPNGNYSLELNTQNNKGVSKFVISK